MDFVASVDQRLSSMEHQLTVKDVRIRQLETNLETHIAAFTKYVNDNEREMQMKNLEFGQLTQHVTSLTQQLSETDTASRELGKRMSNLEQTMFTDRANYEEGREKSGALKSDIGIAEGLVSVRNNVTYDDPTHTDAAFNDSESTEVPFDDVVAEDQIRGRSQLRVAPSPTVAFHTKMSAPQILAIGITMINDEETLDQGDGYNPRDGIYTVPVSGTYVMTWTVLLEVHNFIITSLVVNGEVMGISDTDSQDITDVHQTTTVVLTLNQGDHVFIRVTSTNHGGMVSDTYHGKTTFSGWKI